MVSMFLLRVWLPSMVRLNFKSLGPVEMWLTDIESMMRIALRKLLGILLVFNESRSNSF